MPDIGESAGADETLHHAGHVHVKQWEALPVLEHQDGVSHVLPDGRHFQQVLIPGREDTVVLGSVSCKRAQRGGPSPPQANRFQEVFELSNRRFGELLPAGESLEEAVVKACDSLCPCSLEQDLDAD